MTAINPARLKIQCSELSKQIAEPDMFTRGLHDLLTFYAARVRQTEISKTPLTLQSYQVPPPILRSLRKEMEEPLEANPQWGLVLVDRLWLEDWVEFRRLAISILGTLTTDEPQQILQRISAWLSSCTAEDIRREIMSVGLERLSSQHPQSLQEFLSELIDRGAKADHQAAIFGLSYLAMDPHFEDLPVLFKLLGKILLTEETSLVKEINALVKALRNRSEEETVYFLIGQLPAAMKPRILRVIRGTVKQFNPENRALLREALGKYD